MKLIPFCVRFRVPLTVKQWDKLERKDYLSEVVPKLERAGASNIEYSGYFGRNVYFSVLEFKEAESVLEALKGLL